MARPDTFLGGGLQTARAVVDAGTIGRPLVANAAVMHLGPERWHPNPAFFYGPGGGPMLDVGPYYVAALVGLLGPIVEVSAVARGIGDERLVGSGPRAGETFVSEVPTTVIATLCVRVRGDRRVQCLVRRRRPATPRTSRSTGRTGR